MTILCTFLERYWPILSGQYPRKRRKAFCPGLWRFSFFRAIAQQEEVSLSAGPPLREASRTNPTSPSWRGRQISERSEVIFRVGGRGRTPPLTRSVSASLRRFDLSTRERYSIDQHADFLEAAEARQGAPVGRLVLQHQMREAV